MYVSPDTGIVYKDYNEYCNSDELDTNSIAIKLKAGLRTPKDESERKILEQIREIESEGGIVDLTYGTY